MKKPIPPSLRKPYAPSPPEEKIRHTKSRKDYYDENGSFNDLFLFLKKDWPDLSLDDFLECSFEIFDSNQIEICRYELIDNPNFENQNKKYEKDLEQFTISMKKYIEKEKVFDQEMIKYYRELDLYNLTKAEEEVKILKKKMSKIP